MSFFGGSSSNYGGHRAPSSSSRGSGFFSRPAHPRAASSSQFSSRGGGSSYYKRRPRDGYVQSLIYKLKRLIQDLWDYARRHPLKAFVAIVLPLISAGGALHSLLKQFGVRMPAAFDGMSSTTTYRGGYYGSSGYGSGARSPSFGGFGFGGSDAMGTVGSVVKVARMFL